MSKIIEKKIEDVKNQRKKYLEKYEKYFKDPALASEIIKKDFRKYIAKKEKSRIKLSRQFSKLIIRWGDFYFTKKYCFDKYLAIRQLSPEWEMITYLLSLVEKYAEPYKAKLEISENERLRKEYEKLTGRDLKRVCGCCKAELRDDAKFCHKCGVEWGKEKDMTHTITYNGNVYYCNPKDMNIYTVNPENEERKECGQCKYFYQTGYDMSKKVPKGNCTNTRTIGMNGISGDRIIDDCKHFISWKSSGICENCNHNRGTI